MMQKQTPCKIVIAGDGGTGKSTLITAKNTGKFQYASNITIGVDFACLDLEFNNQMVPFLIYDLGGQQRFQFLHDTYINGSKGAIVMYDLTRRKTFDNINRWLDLLHKEDPKMPIILVGSKKDLAQQEDILHFKNEIKFLQKAKKIQSNIIGHSFISSKSMDGVYNLFDSMAKKILPRFLSSQKINSREIYSS